jgi:hypothetical protein
MSNLERLLESASIACGLEPGKTGYCDIPVGKVVQALKEANELAKAYILLSHHFRCKKVCCCDTGTEGTKWLHSQEKRFAEFKS